MPKKAKRPRTLNRGASDARDGIVRRIRRVEAKIKASSTPDTKQFCDEMIQLLDDLRIWIDGAVVRALKKPGGL